MLLQEKSALQQTKQKLFLLEVLEQFYAGLKLHLKTFRGMIAAEGILTSRGGVSSHAALVARQMNKVCVCGAAEVVINYKKETLTIGKKIFKNGDAISIDGTTGEIFAGAVATAPSEVDQVLNGKLKAKNSYTYKMYDQVMKWADKYRKLGVRTNADSPDQAASAIKYGAQGIGLCRTEHMFFEGDRITFMRQMILASDEKNVEKHSKNFYHSKERILQVYSKLWEVVQ